MPPPQALRKREAAERALKRANDQRDSTAEAIKGGNAWFTRKRPATRKDYLAGKAHFHWDCSFVALGHRYELSLVARRADCAGEASGREVIPTACRDGNLDGAGDGQDKLVFVGEVEFVDRVEGVIPSLVWLRIPNQLNGDRPAFSDPRFQPPFQVCFTLHDREAGIVEGLPAGACALSNQVIEGGAQVMDRVADDQRQLPGGESMTLVNAETVAITFEVRLERDLLWMAAEEALGRIVKVRNMASCSLDL